LNLARFDNIIATLNEEDIGPQMYRQTFRDPTCLADYLKLIRSSALLANGDVHAICGILSIFPCSPQLWT
jgi:hypothetical protein